ncbi:HD domain-containing protein [Actinoplanes sp. NPDC051494]|uniref:HD domain-containing protein n=1 Tax=Actinoplanes sp. NPDC051494 TaxID=3363907 RepID=UPI00378DA452
MTPTVAGTDALANLAHHGQVDKAGHPYIDHPRTVARILRDQGYSDNVIMAGLLHDVVEDSTLTLNDLRELGYPESTVRAVDSVTRRAGEDYMDLVRRAAADPVGRLVKLADNETNSDPARLALLTPDEQARLTQKYAKARAVLLGETS